MSSIEIDPEAWAEFEALFDANHRNGQTVEHLRKEVREFLPSSGWSDWWPTGPMPYEDALLQLLKRSISRRRYFDKTLWQLWDGDYKFWVYNAARGHLCRCNDQHRELDGLVFPRDHPFWAEWVPPNDWWCDCSVYGARTLAGIVRLGGDLDKVLPADFDRRPTEGFRGNRSPTLFETLEAVLCERAPVLG